MNFPNMLPNQGTNTGVTTQHTNYNANGDNDILSEALRCIKSSDPPQNQTLDNYSPPNIEPLVGAINDLQTRVQGCPIRLSRYYWRYAPIYGELNSPQIGADSHELLAVILVKIFAREYHDITTTFSAQLHETSTILYEFLRHTYAILRHLFDITTGLYEFIRVLYV